MRTFNTTCSVTQVCRFHKNAERALPVLDLLAYFIKTRNNMQYCTYYQALVKRQETWFFTAVLRSYEHLTFDRTLNAEEGLFEFFVPPSGESQFEELMAEFAQRGIVSHVVKLPNRLADPSAQV